MLFLRGQQTRRASLHDARLFLFARVVQWPPRIRIQLLEGEEPQQIFAVLLGYIEWHRDVLAQVHALPLTGDPVADLMTV